MNESINQRKKKVEWNEQKEWKYQARGKQYCERRIIK